MSVLDKIKSVFVHIATPFYVLRAPIIAAGVAAVMLSTPDQALEIYRAMALGLGDSAIQIALAFVTLALQGLLIWYIGRNLTLLWQQNELSAGGFLVKWLPRIVAIVPMVAAAIGLWRAAGGIPSITVPESIEEKIPGLLDEVAAARSQMDEAFYVLQIGAAICIFMAIVLIVITYLRSLRKQWKYEKPNRLLFSLGARSFFSVVALALAGGLIAFFFVNPRELSAVAGDVGALAIFNVFVICLAFFLGVLTNFYDRTSVPVLSVIVIMALIATAFDLNDNHRIRTLDQEMITRSAGPEQAPVPKPTQAEVRGRKYPGAAAAFQQWIGSRPDRSYYASQGRDYPVYIVAAQGGGLYAAHQAAATLARLQDRCGGFAQHVFAISGVSGGSLGAALFSSLVKAYAQPAANHDCQRGASQRTDYQDRIERFLANDFMAPLTVAGFFPDLVQRIVPYPIPRFDRARALEASFERAWDIAAPDAPTNPFAESYYNAWDPTGLAPALILNATSVRTGNRVVFSPFHFRRQTSDRVRTLQRLIQQPVALSTAVGVSARFPWVLPAASWSAEPRARRRRRSIRKSRRQTPQGPRYYRFVDGGYFEFSGVETALDVIDVIENVQEQREHEGLGRLRIQVSLIVLSDDEIIEDAVGSDNRIRERRATTKRTGFGELVSPITALLNSRLSRGSLSVTRAVQDLCPDCYRSRRDRRALPGFDGEARIFRLNLTDFSLTLGWQLSSATRRIIAAHAGEAHKCFARPPGGARDERNWFAKVVNENNCAACRIVYDLTAAPTVGPVIASRSVEVSLDTGPVKRHPYLINLPPGGALLCQ